MKSTKLALAIVLLCGSLSACKQEAPAVAEDATPTAAAEPAMDMSESMDMDTTMPPPVDPDATEDGTDDLPHTGGDRVGTGGGGNPDH